jgi:hypothetical protein
VEAADNVYATAVLSGTPSHYLFCTNFGFSIPAGATINGILCEVRGCVSASMEISTAKLIKAGAVTGNAKSQLSGFAGCPRSAGVYDGQLGSSSDLWGATLAASDVNASNFGVAVSCNDTNGQGETVNVDHIRLTIYYTPAAGSSSVGLSALSALSGLSAEVHS